MPTHSLTVDVEDWYHVENLRSKIPPASWDQQPARLEANVDRLLELFAGCGARATFFVLGAAAKRHLGVVRRIVDAGHELACHGFSHDLIYRQEPEVFRAETRDAKALLEDQGGCAVSGYRGSTFSITKRSLWALEIIAEEGFSYDSSIAPLRHDRYGIPDAPQQPYAHTLAGGLELVEFPISCFRFMGKKLPLGGGFFRLLPLRYFVRAFEQYAAAGQSGSIYIHPWEIDPDQPRVDGLGRIAAFRHYTGLAKLHDKLHRLLQTATFTTMRDVLSREFPRVGADCA